MRITRSHDLNHEFIMLSHNSLMFLHHFILMVNFVFVILIVFPLTWIYFLDFFFQSHHSMFDWLKIEFYNFFYTVILVSWLWNDNPDCDRSFSLMFFSTRFFFNFIIQHWVYWIFNFFFIVLYTRTIMLHDLRRKFATITRIDLRLYFTFYVKPDPHFL